MQKIIFGIVIAVVVVGGLILVARPDSKNNTASISSGSPGTLNAEELSFDFGTVSMANGNVSRSIKIKNTGVNSVVIGKMYTSCMCTVASLIKNGEKFGPFGMPGHGFVPAINESMNPDEEATVEIVFDPNAHGPAGVGRIQRVITIENNGGQPLELEFTALVTP